MNFICCYLFLQRTYKIDLLMTENSAQLINNKYDKQLYIYIKQNYFI